MTTFSETPVPDYSEQPADTWRRLEKAELLKSALKKWEKVRAQLGLTKTESRAQRFLWLRTHYPKTSEPSSSGLNETSSSSAETLANLPDSPLPPDTHAESTTSLFVPATPEPCDLTRAPTIATPSEADSTLTDSTDDETPNPGYPKREWKVHPDNSVTIEPADLTLGLTLDEVMMAARWALLHANHVACRRMKMRDAPTQIAWVFVNWVLDKPGEFMRVLMEKFADIEKAKLASAEKIELAKIAAEEKREEKQQARMDDNRNLRNLSARVEAAAQRSARRLLSVGAEGHPSKS